MSLEDVIGGGALPKRPLLITFDDAYRSVLDTGAPLLREYGVRPVFCIITAPVFEGEMPLDNLISYAVGEAPEVLAEVCGGGGALSLENMPFEKKLLAGMRAGEQRALRDHLARRLGGTAVEWGRQSGLYLTPADLPALIEAGFSIGCHTRSHVLVDGLQGEDLESEIVAPLEQLATATGRPVQAFSFPYGGGATPAALDTLRRHGVRRWFFVGRRSNPRTADGPLYRADISTLDAGLLGSEIETMPALQALCAKLWRFGAREAS